MANPFEILVSNLNQLGFFGFLLPFLFIFVVIYAILLKTKVLGENQKIIGVLSLIVAFFVIGYGGVALGTFFKTLFGLLTIALAGLLIIILFLGMGGGDFGKVTDPKVAGAILVIIGLIIFFAAAAPLGIRLGNDLFQIILIIVVIGVAVGFVTQGGKS